MPPPVIRVAAPPIHLSYRKLNGEHIRSAYGRELNRYDVFRRGWRDWRWVDNRTGKVSTLVGNTGREVVSSVGQSWWNGRGPVKPTPGPTIPANADCKSCHRSITRSNGPSFVSFGEILHRPQRRRALPQTASPLPPPSLEKPPTPTRIVKPKDGIDGRNGIDGKDGKTGRGIASVSIVNGDLVVEFTDGTMTVVGRVKGDKGNPGHARTVTVIIEDLRGKKLAKSVLIPPDKSTVRIPILDSD